MVEQRPVMLTPNFKTKVELKMDFRISMFAQTGSFVFVFVFEFVLGVS